MARRGETPEAKQRRIWDKAAPAYDRQMAWLERFCFAGGREWLAERAHGRVLEVAIGTGLTLPHYAPGLTVTGLDMSAEMAVRARERAASLGRSVEVVVGDAEHLPFGDATYDSVVCALGLCTIADPARAIAEMRRVLVPGGRLLLLDHVASSSRVLRAGQRLVELVSVPLANEHYTRRQLPLVEEAGFEVVENERLRAGTVERLHAVKR
jgi:ubiquinone/menaquinone biosynthesis C-methylase UbiE